MSTVDLVVPDIGNFADILVVEVLVAKGDSVNVDSPLVTLETDKASMDVPATAAGTVTEVLLKAGDRVSKGSVIARVQAATQGEETKPAPPAKSADKTRAPEAKKPEAAAATRGEPAGTAARKEPAKSPADKAPGATPSRPSASDAVSDTKFDRSTQLLVLGSGPGGYTAAFRAADLGLKVTLVERWATLGGVCLNVGCIPSKALLHAAKVIEDAEAMGANGIAFGKPSINRDKLRGWKTSVVNKLTGGLKVLAKQRKVEVVQGSAQFVSANVIEVAGSGGTERIRFDMCIIAAGSEPVKLPGLPTDPRVMDSTDALELPEFSGGMLVIGGGIIGLEMACVYDGLGSRVSVVELTPTLMPGTDADLVRPLEKRIKARYEAIMTGTRVTGVEALASGLRVTFEGGKDAKQPVPGPTVYDRVLVAVGRVPNGKVISADKAGVAVSERGFIPVDKQMRTNVPHIFAIGDVAGPPMLAHKAMHEAKVAAEVAAGHKSAFDARVIPSVAYTDPEIAWVGLTETEATAKKIPFKKGQFPWAANGRSLSLGREDGFTKLLFDPQSRRVLGGGIVGTNAGDLISEVALAIEMGSDAADIGLTVHPHPTVSETVAGAADAFEGTLTDLYIPKR